TSPTLFCSLPLHDALPIYQLQSLGCTVDRLQEDLVDRGEIAARVGITRQAVGHWINRVYEVPFPAPAHHVPGPVWLWGDIVRWRSEEHTSELQSRENLVCR